MLPSRQTLANAIRALAMDAVQEANSGHPGMPMGMADIAEVLWRDFLRHNPKNPHWMNRDRFVLSNGHGCMLQYALLHLTGYDLSLDDLKAFRQLHSKTPGHPEYGHTPGVEATGGPLGQGLAMSVGMAIAEKHLAAEFNTPGFSIVDHYTYVFVGDGCLMEGISHEVCSLAGTLGLSKLIVFYDDNGISIDGNVFSWFTDNTPKRFEAYGWHVIEKVNGHDANDVEKAIILAQSERYRPTLICCQTQIGFGAPNLAGSEKTHGAPLGHDEIRAAKKTLGWDYGPFEVPNDIYQAWNMIDTGIAVEREWNHLFAKYKAQYPEKASEFLRRTQQHFPDDWMDKSKAFIKSTLSQEKPMATRKASLSCINAYSDLLPELIGGSADLSGSNCTLGVRAEKFSEKQPEGNYIYYGVREFGMSAIMNGLALHQGVIPFGGTFLVFSDYARNAIRLSALMNQKVIYVLTHDSIGLGEDGPTHQPIEHIAMLRMTPNMMVWRPCDFTETAMAWQQALMHKGPSALLLSRQDLPQQSHDAEQLTQMHRGAYVLYEPKKSCDMLMLATGSEVALAVAAAKQLSQENIAVRVISMLCCERFKMQDAAYREQILPKKIHKRLAIEASVPDYWYQFVGDRGAIMGINTFGASAPDKDLWRAYGFTIENIIQKIMTLRGKHV